MKTKTKLSNMSGVVGIIALATLTTSWATAQPATEAHSTFTSKPNIVFILVDNVGGGAFGVYGGTVATPRIDELAKQGIRFNNYNVEVQCTPTRCSSAKTAS